MAARWPKCWRGGEVNAPRGNATRAKQYGALRQRVHSTALYGTVLFLLSLSLVPVTTIRAHASALFRPGIKSVSMREVIVRDAYNDCTLLPMRTFRFESIYVFFVRKPVDLYDSTDVYINIS